MRLKRGIAERLGYLWDRWNYLNPTHPLRKSTRYLIRSILILLRALLWVGLVVVLGYSAWNLWERSQKEERMAPLYEDLDREEAVEIGRILDQRGAGHRLSPDSTAVLALPEELPKLRLELASQQYPRSGRLRFAVPDSGADYRSALERQLGRTLLAQEEIDFVDVKLEPAETPVGTRSFASARIKWASVQGAKLGEEQEELVKYLVKSCVPSGKITIDELHLPLKEQRAAESFALSEAGRQVREAIERILERKAQTLMDQLIGVNRVVVRVAIVLPQHKERGELETIIGSDGEIITPLRVEIIIDRTKLYYDLQKNEFAEGDRSHDEIDNLVSAIKAVVGYRGERGDQVLVQTGQFKTAEVAAHLYRGQKKLPQRINNPGWKEVATNLEIQFQTERILENKVQTLMDQMIGKDRSKVRIDVALDISGMVSANNDLKKNTGINRQAMVLVIDKTNVVIDTVADARNSFIEVERSQEEIGKLAELASKAVGFDEQRGDRVIAFSLVFDKTQELTARQQEEQEASTKFWTDVAITVAKVLGILATLLTLRFIIRVIGMGVGEQEDDILSDEGQVDALLSEYGKELDMARKMQMGLMPATDPEIAGFDIAGLCRPATQVGGDFFQFLQMGADRWLICLADATGHGMSAAIPLVMFSGMLKSRLREGGMVEELLEGVNRSMHGSMTGDTLTGRTFVCFCGGEIQTETRRIRLTNSGCPYPFHFRAAEGTVVEVEISGYPLGVRPSHSYRIVDVQLEPGDRVVFCTDGIIEADDRFGHMFGFDRMAYLVREGCRQGYSSRDLVDYLMRQVDIFSEGKPQQDDQTVIVVSVEP